MKDEFKIGMNVCWKEDILLGINKDVACAIKDIETSMIDGFYFEDGLRTTGICHGSLKSIIEEIRRLHKK